MNPNNNGQNNLGNNRAGQNPNQGVPNNGQNGSSFIKPTRENYRPGHSSSSFQDSLSKRPTRMSDEKPSAKEMARDKILDFIPGGRKAKKAMDWSRKVGNGLDNIRAKRGPQLPILPPADNNTNNNNQAQSANNKNNFSNNQNGSERGLGRPSFLPKRPNFLGNNNDDDYNDEDGDQEEQKPRSLLGGNKQKNNSKGGFSFLGKGFLQMSPIVKIVLLVLVIMLPFLFLFMALSPLLVLNSTSAIGIADGNSDYKANEEEEKFQERINEVKQSYSNDGKNFEAKYIGAVYTVLSTYGEGYSYKKMTKSKIEEIADLMFDDNGSFSEETFKNNLINKYFPSKIPGKDEKTYKRYVSDMFEILKYYNDNKNGTTASSGTTGDVCTYKINDVNAELYGTGIKSLKITASDIKVRLMSAGDMCGGTYGQPLEGEELVPFEKYILGVAYNEINTNYKEAAFKTQLIVARSYALSIASATASTNGRKLVEEDGQWILQIPNCVVDMGYCDPDRGCSTYGAANDQNQLYYSGVDTKPVKRFGPLAADAPERQWAKEVAGKVALDSSGRVYLTNFVNTDQERWEELAQQGLDYTQIIMKHYPNVSSIGDSDCVDNGSEGTGEYTAWKQYDSKWSSVVLGGGSDSSRSINSIGCLATSISMLIEKSGALNNLSMDANLRDNFNPGTFVEAMNKVGGFDSGGRLYWAKVGEVVPGFNYAESEKKDLSGLPKIRKLSEIKERTSKANTYCVVEVKGNEGQHWVAVDTVNEGTIKIFDPGSNATSMWDEYKWGNTSTIQCFKKG